MTSNDELLSQINKILKSVENDKSVLESLGQNEDGQKIIQLIQIGKYVTNIGEGNGNSIGDRFDPASLEEILDLLQQQVASAQLDYTTWKIAQNKHFSDSLKSSKGSLAAFKQIIDIKSQDVNFIKRQELFDRLDSWYAAWNEQNQILTIAGEEGDGKTWSVAYWLEQQIHKSDDFPAVVFLPSNSKIDRDLVDIVSEIVAGKLDRSSDTCKSNIKTWLDRPAAQHPILLLVLDGINEHHKFPLWRTLINALSTSPWNNKVAVLITCRQEYWQRNKARDLPPEIYNLLPYNEAELTEALQINHLNRSAIAQNLIPLISKPRYFDLMVKYRERIAASGDITFQRLIYEDWRDRYERKTDIALSDDGFQSLIRELAAKQVEKLNTRRISAIEVDSIIPSMYDKLEVFNEIESSGIIKGKRRAIIFGGDERSEMR
jgi:Effector-associated domain 10